MARFVIVVLFGAVVVGLAMGVAASVRRAAVAGRGHLARIEKEHGTMQRVSGLLLLALIVYAAFWGGA